MLLAALSACAPGEGTADKSASGSSAALAEPIDSGATDWADVAMPSARVSFMFCGEEEGGIQIRSMSREALTDVLNRCLPAGFVGVRITYDGPIEPGAAELFRRIDQLAVEIDPDTLRYWPFLLMINSGGGDVAEAMAFGNVLARRDWSIRVDPRDGRCYSACVLVYAAATDREEPDTVRSREELWRAVRRMQGDPQDRTPISEDTNLGIHRVLPTLSAATSVDELYADTEMAVKLIGDYLAMHGVSRTLAEDMMTVPSNEIRILKIDEVEKYGLGKVNSARADLDRLDILRRCGADYAERRAIFLREWKACTDLIRGEESVPAAEACVDSLKQRTRIPDAACKDPKVGG